MHRSFPNLNETGYRWLRGCPESVRKSLKPFIYKLLGILGYPCGGPLIGCRIRGEFSRAYWDGTYEPQVSRILLQIVKSGWTCADLGAHVGYFTLLLAKLVGEDGQVIAFEAHPGNAKRVCANVRLNRFEKRVRVENYAVLDKSNSSVSLYAGRGQSATEWNVIGRDSNENPTKAELEIPSITLDDYFPPKARLDFVKMDIEGAEAMAIPGMKRLLTESRPLLLVEFHNETAWAVRNELFAADYLLYDLSRNRWLDEKLDLIRVYHCLAVPSEQALALDL